MEWDKQAAEFTVAHWVWDAFLKFPFSPNRHCQSGEAICYQLQPLNCSTALLRS